jgi:uncharacterized protein (TIGR03437 family)
MRRTSACPNAFVTKLNPTKPAITYSTYLGTPKNQYCQGSSVQAYGIAVDSTGDAYVVGTTNAFDFPGAPLESHAPVSIVNYEGTAAFIVKFNLAGSALIYSTYLGGPYGEKGNGIGVDSSGNAYVTGSDLNYTMVGKLDGPFVFAKVNRIVNAASFDFSVAPGSIASIFGNGLSGLAPQTVAVLVSQAGCVSTAAPVFYVSASQINFQVPWELCAQGTYVSYLAVSVNGLTSDTENVGFSVASFGPGIFTIDASGTGQGAILIGNTGQLAAAAGSIPGTNSRRAKPNEYLTIYCTGLGPVTTPPPRARRRLSARCL